MAEESNSAEQAAALTAGDQQGDEAGSEAKTDEATEALSVESAEAVTASDDVAPRPLGDLDFRSLWQPSQDALRALRSSMLPNLAEMQRRILGDAVKSWGPGWSKTLVQPITDDFLRQVRVQVPVFDFTKLVSPELRRSLAAAADWLKALVPENLQGFKFGDWERLIEVSEEQRLGIVWVPRGDVLRALLDAESEQDRNRVLAAWSADVLEDCQRSLALTTHPDLEELVVFAVQAVEAHRAGLTAAAQALATNVLDTALEQHHVRGVKGMLAACKRLHEKDADEDSVTLLQMRLRLATAGIPHAYRTYDYEKRDGRYSRNGTAHAVNMALYTPENSVRAITLATSWLRWLHETWTTEQRRAA
jgi:predicted metal-dependent HD superfamily phosphohydrolase